MLCGIKTGHDFSMETMTLETTILTQIGLLEMVDSFRSMIDSGRAVPAVNPFKVNSEDNPGDIL
jgi:hypothetical protein